MQPLRSFVPCHHARSPSSASAPLAPSAASSGGSFLVPPMAPMQMQMMPMQMQMMPMPMPMHMMQMQMQMAQQQQQAMHQMYAPHAMMGQFGYPWMAAASQSQPQPQLPMLQDHHHAPLVAQMSAHPHPARLQSQMVQSPPPSLFVRGHSPSAPDAAATTTPDVAGYYGSSNSNNNNGDAALSSSSSSSAAAASAALYLRPQLKHESSATSASSYPIEAASAHVKREYRSVPQQRDQQKKQEEEKQKQSVNHEAGPLSVAMPPPTLIAPPQQPSSDSSDGHQQFGGGKLAKRGGLAGSKRKGSPRLAIRGGRRFVTRNYQGKRLRTSFYYTQSQQQQQQQLIDEAARVQSEYHQQRLAEEAEMESDAADDASEEVMEAQLADGRQRMFTARARCQQHQDNFWRRAWRDLVDEVEEWSRDGEDLRSAVEHLSDLGEGETNDMLAARDYAMEASAITRWSCRANADACEIRRDYEHNY